jgi:hypothetical protein
LGFLGSNWVCFGFKMGLFGFELALFFEVLQSKNWLCLAKMRVF